MLFGKHLSIYHKILINYASENMKGKGKTESNDHLISFPHCFQTVFFPVIIKIQDYVVQGRLITKQSRLLVTRKKKAFGNIVGKGENAGHQHFLLFPHFFPSFQIKLQFLSHTSFVICNCFQFGPV